MRSRLFSTLVLLVAVIAPSIDFAQPLADKLPDDAVIYYGWRGTDDLGPGYPGSHFKEFLDASQIRQLLTQFLPQALNRLGQEDRKAAEVLQVAQTIVPILVKHSGALYVGPVDDLGTKQPKPRIAIICDAGDDSATLNNVLTQLFAQMPKEMPIAVKFETRGSLVIVTVGQVKIDPAAKTLATRKEFTDAMAQVSDDGGKDATAAFYLDFEYVVAQAEQLSLQNDMVHGIWQNVRDGTGIAGLKRVAAANGFDGKDFGARLFISAPKPRTGLLALADSAPLGDGIFKFIPVSSTAAMAARFDPAKLLTTVREIATKVGFDPQLEQGLQQINSIIGFDLDKDLLQAAGDEWAIYSSPMVGGDGILGMVAIGKPRDPAKFEQSMGTLEHLANSIIIREASKHDPKPQFMQVRDGDTTIHYLATPLLTPSWAIRDGVWIGGLSPQAVSAAGSVVAEKGKSILDNEGFQAVRQRLGADKASAIEFVDLPKLAPQMYPLVLLISRATGFGDLFGVPSPAMVLPPLPKLLPLLSPAGAAFWADDDGYHGRCVTPFPGAELLGGSATALVGPGAAAAALAVPLLSVRKHAVYQALPAPMPVSR